MDNYVGALINKNTDPATSVVELEPLTRKSFNNKLWRKILADTCHEIDIQNIGLEVISPWGFELLEDTSFLTRKLRRFYCYIGVPIQFSLDRKIAVSEFAQALFKRLALLGTNMLDDIVLVIEHDELKKLRHDDYTCKSTDKLLDIQLRIVEQDILSDYANYVITSLEGLCFAKGESAHFYESRIWRCRHYQLYIMQECLYHDLLPAMSTEQQQAYRSLFPLVDNMIQQFYKPELASSTPNEQELYLLEELIKKRISLMRSVIAPKEKSDAVVISSNAYHIEDKLEITLDKSVYENAFKKIKSSYLNFV